MNQQPMAWSDVVMMLGGLALIALVCVSPMLPDIIRAWRNKE